MMIGHRTYESLLKTILANTGLEVVNEQWIMTGESVVVRIGHGSQVLFTFTCLTYNGPGNWFIGPLSHMEISDMQTERKPADA